MPDQRTGNFLCWITLYLLCNLSCYDKVFICSNIRKLHFSVQSKYKSNMKDGARLMEVPFGGTRTHWRKASASGATRTLLRLRRL